MPKSKRYVQNRYSIIWRLIREGKINCLPVYFPSAFPGEEPTVVFNLERRRPRMPYLVATKRRQLKGGNLAKRRRRKDNRSTLPIGPWISTYVAVGSRSPLQEVLDRGDPDELRRHYIVTDTKPPRVKIFQLLKDFSAALRQSEHIFAQYQDDLAALYRERSELESNLRRLREEGIVYEIDLNVRVRIAAINLRIAEIQHIGADRAARDLSLHFVVREAFLRLQQYGEGLDELARSVSRMRKGFRRDGLLAYLNGLDQDLTFFASKEILPFRAAARKEIRRIKRDEEKKLSNGQIVAALFRVKQSLTKAAVRLGKWSVSLTKKEVRKSQTMRRFVAEETEP